LTVNKVFGYIADR